MKQWRVLLGCFIGMGVAVPALLLIPLGLYVKPVTAEFGWSRTQFSTIVSLAALVNGLSMPLAGYLVDRFGARRVAVAGTALGCASYAAISLANSYAGLIALVALAATTGNLASYPAFMGLAQRWFDKRLGLALAVTSAATAPAPTTSLCCCSRWRRWPRSGCCASLVSPPSRLARPCARRNPGPLRTCT